MISNRTCFIIFLTIDVPVFWAVCVLGKLDGATTRKEANGGIPVSLSDAFYLDNGNVLCFYIPLVIFIFFLFLLFSSLNIDRNRGL